MTRCKFICGSKEETVNGYRIKLNAVACGSKENEDFFRWTPAGLLDLQIVNPEAANNFEVGKYYYIDISEA